MKFQYFDEQYEWFQFFLVLKEGPRRLAQIVNILICNTDLMSVYYLFSCRDTRVAQGQL